MLFCLFWLLYLIEVLSAFGSRPFSSFLSSLGTTEDPAIYYGSNSTCGSTSPPLSGLQLPQGLCLGILDLAQTDVMDKSITVFYQRGHNVLLKLQLNAC